MKRIILIEEIGMALYSLSIVTSKNLLSVYDKPIFSFGLNDTFKF